MVSPLVRFRSVVALIDRFPVLAGLDLDVEAGEIVLLRGPNGAGKTSLLRVAAGLLPVTSGDASVLGVDITRDRRAVRSKIGFLAHEMMLYGELSVLENLDLIVRALGVECSAGPKALERVGLTRRVMALPVDRLSAGQRRRAALAGLLVRDPALWLLDEPHTGLDHDSRALLDELMCDAAARGRTVLFSSHEVDRARDLAHRELHIVNGVVDPTAFTGDVVDLRSRVDVS